MDAGSAEAEAEELQPRAVPAAASPEAAVRPGPGTAGAVPEPPAGLLSSMLDLGHDARPLLASYSSPMQPHAASAASPPGMPGPGAAGSSRDDDDDGTDWYRYAQHAEAGLRQAQQEQDDDGDAGNDGSGLQYSNAWRMDMDAGTSTFVLPHGSPDADALPPSQSSIPQEQEHEHEHEHADASALPASSAAARGFPSFSFGMQDGGDGGGGVGGDEGAQDMEETVRLLPPSLAALQRHHQHHPGPQLAARAASEGRRSADAGVPSEGGSEAANSSGQYLFSETSAGGPPDPYPMHGLEGGGASGSGSGRYAYAGSAGVRSSLGLGLGASMDAGSSLSSSMDAQRYRPMEQTMYLGSQLQELRLGGGVGGEGAGGRDGSGPALGASSWGAALASGRGAAAEALEEAEEAPMQATSTLLVGAEAAGPAVEAVPGQAAGAASRPAPRLLNEDVAHGGRSLAAPTQPDRPWRKARRLHPQKPPH